MIKVIRTIHSHLHIIDSIYYNDKLQFEQSNFNRQNRFKTSLYKCNNGKVLTVDVWERGEKEI